MVVAESRPRLQTESARQTQMHQVEKDKKPERPSRPPEFDEFIRQMDLIHANANAFVREGTRLLNERRSFPRFTAEQDNMTGLMKKLALAMVNSECLTEAEKWALIAMYREQKTLAQRMSAIINALPKATIRWLAESGYVIDAFCLAGEALQLAAGLGDIARLIEHSGDAAIRTFRAAAAGLGSPGWGMCIWKDWAGRVQVRSQYMGEPERAA